MRFKKPIVALSTAALLALAACGGSSDSGGDSGSGGGVDKNTLGKMVADAVDYYSDYPLYLWMPVGTIALITLSLNLLGDSIRDAFDPRTRR